MRLLALAAAFFLSGTAALIYQTVWQRVVALHTGIGLYSISVIVASFMLGIGIGSHLGGGMSVRLSERRALRAFGAVEVAIALWGAASGWLYYDLLYLRGAWLYESAWRAVVLHAVGLGIPTTLMGMSLPLLVRATVRDAHFASRTIGLLYGLNVLGAATGAIAGPVFLVRHFGMKPALLAAAGANLLAGLAAVLLTRWAREADDLEEKADLDRPSGATVGFGAWAMLYAFSGFCALGLELLWFRIFEISVKASAFTFGALLAVYLLGNGVGSLVGSWWTPRLQRPLRAFLLAQCALLAYAAAVLALIVGLPATTGWLAPYVEHWGRSRVLTLGTNIDVTLLLRLYVYMPLLTFGPPTLLMGFSYPVLQRAVQDDPLTSGRKVGLLQAANIAGCVAGSLLVGLVLLDLVGTAGTLTFLLACGLVFAAVGMKVEGLRSPYPVAAAVIAVLLALVPSQKALWLRFHGSPEGDTLLAEDATGVVLLVPNESRWSVWAGGRSHSWLPFGSIHTVLGAAPAIVHPDPRRIAVIGLGSGDTAWAAGARTDVPQDVSVYEIYAQEREVLAQLARRRDAPAGLAAFLSDPRMRFLVQDGRNALLRSDPDFDVIEMDALWPVSPYSGNLYSREFFEMSASRLKPGGLMCIWAPTRRVRVSFASAFPHVLALGGAQVLIGSRDPIRFDLAAWEARLRSREVSLYLGEQNAAEVWKMLSTAVPFNPRRVQEDDYNHDLFPRDEFRTPEREKE
jgi:spermidine synthase